MKKLLGGLFILCLLLVGSQAHASTLSDALLKIKNLEKEIAQLKTSLQGAVAIPGISGTFVPVVASPIVTNITSTSATIGATVTSLGSPAAHASSMCVDKYDGTTGCSTSGVAVGPFTRNVTALTPGTTYYFKGNAISTYGTGWSGAGSFSTLAATAPAQPLITLLSPNGGEKYQPGQQITVAWKTVDMPDARVNVVLYNSNNTAVNEITDIINVNQVTFKLPTIAGQYRFQINTKNYGTVSDWSDNTFTINPATSACSLSATVIDTYLSTDKTGWGFHINVNVKDKPSNSNGWVANFEGYTPVVTGYGVNKIYGNFFLSSGPLNITAVDQVDSNCKVTTTITPPTVTTPSITVLSPNGGEVYKAGDQITVKWTSSNFPSSSTVLIGLSSSLKNEKQELSTTLNDGQETITIPTSAFQGNYPLASGNYYKIGIELGGNPNLSDSSDNSFTINAASTSPIIKVISPNDGETYTVGDKVVVFLAGGLYMTRVGLVYPDFNPNNPISDGNDVHWMSVVSDSGKSFVWDGSSFIDNNGNKNYWSSGAGNYKIVAIRDVNDTKCYQNKISDCIYDISDNAIKIVSAKSPVDSSVLGKISYWWGKYNLHTSSNGAWVSDSASDAGAALDMMTYCKRWFPGTTEIQEGGTESIGVWQSSGSYPAQSSNKPVYKCVASSITGSATGDVSVDKSYVYQNDAVTVSGSVKNTASTSQTYKGVLSLLNESLTNTDSTANVYQKEFTLASGGSIGFSSQFTAMSAGYNFAKISVYLKTGTTYSLVSQKIERVTVGAAVNPSKDNGCSNGEIYSSTTGAKCPVSNVPIISGVSGPQLLKTYEVGTWKITASDSTRGDLSYSVIWGDEAFGSSSSLKSTSAYSQAATLTHSYTRVGTFNPKFTVMNSIGGTATTSLTVNVFDPAVDNGCSNGQKYNSMTGAVCLQNGCLNGEVYSSTTGALCPVTYGGVQPTQTTYNTPIVRTLKIGIKGEDVKRLQTFLGIKADGSFGKGTAAKVKEWQVTNGLKADGAFGMKSALKAGLTQ